MQKSKQQKWLMAAAMAIMPVLASQTARAQFAAPVGSGHALDANNRIGSGGINDAVNNGPLVTPNDIVYGNVTGGRGLTGNLREADPREFLGTLPGSGVDSFIAGTSGAPTAYSPQFSLSDPRPFYGSSRGVAPPAGSVLLGSTGSAVGTDLSSGNPYAASPGLDQFASQRVGTTNIVGVSGQSPTLLAMPGDPGSSSPNMQSALLGSPLYGVRLSSSLQNSDLILNPDVSNGTATPLGSNNLDQIAIQQQLLLGTNGTAQQGTSANGLNSNNSSDQNAGSDLNPNGPAANPTGQPPVPGSINGGPLQMPLNSPLNSSFSSSRLGQPLESTPLNTYHEGNSAIQLVPPAVYSPAYQRMQMLVNRYNGPQKSASTASRKGSAAGPTSRPANSNGFTAPDTVPPLNAEPVKIDSLADGIKVKQLHDVLAAGDDALKQGNYKSAIDQYTSAVRVAPNNGLFVLGRANAELAAGYYGQAEMDIRRTVRADPTVLMARFNLSTMMSADRLAYVQKDLQGLTSDSKASRPWFLLAYLSYNEGDTTAAASDLQEAKKRSVANDAVIALMEKYWSLPSSKPEMNK